MLKWRKTYYCFIKQKGYNITMFRKLVSHLPFSPALMGQVGFYAKRLRKEETTRRVGLVFVALALIVQSFSVFQAPEPANAASSNDMIYGGVRGISDTMAHYDQNTQNFRDIIAFAGITRDELAQAKQGTWSTPGTIGIGQNSYYSYAQGERALRITNGNGQYVKTVYARPQTLGAGNKSFPGLIGYSAHAGWFAIMNNCGNLITRNYPSPPPAPTPPPPPAPTPNATCTGLVATITSRTSVRLDATASASNGATLSSYVFTVKNAAGQVVKTDTQSTSAGSARTSFTLPDGGYSADVVVKTSVGDKTGAQCAKQFTVIPPEKCPLNPELTVEDDECQPCPGDPSIWVKDEDCAAQIVKSKSGTNLDQNADATTVVARAGQKIKFTITAKNDGKAATKIALVDELRDTLEYATLFDAGGGQLNEQTKQLSWGEVELQPGASVTKTFIVKMLDTIPTSAQGISDADSYDCVMVNTFGNSTSINVDCPTPKIVEQTVSELPKTGPAENMLFAGIVLAIATYFYARSRQLKTEVRLIRRSAHVGAL